MAIERLEGVGGAIVLGVPAFDFFVWVLDNYGRFDLLLTIHDRLPKWVTSPAPIFLCVCLGLWLLHDSHERQIGRLLERKQSGLLGSSGETLLRREKEVWFIPVLITFIGVLALTLVLAVGYTLAYEADTPVAEKQRPPLYAYDKTPPPRPIPLKSDHGPSIDVGSQGPCSINQAGGSHNTATATCAPISRELPEKKYQNFVDTLKTGTGKIIVIQAGTTDDIIPLSYQMCDAAHAAHWGSFCPASQESIIRDSRVPLIKGVQCFSSNWNAAGPTVFRKAADRVKLGCEYQDHDYVVAPGIHFIADGTVGVTIVIGRPR